MKIILASQSPRRKELLSYLVNEFDVCSADIDESVQDNEPPIDYVERLALEKAQAIFEENSDQNVAVIGADTTVVFEKHILGKPESLAESKQMLTMLSGQTHQVLTSFSLVTPQGRVTKTVSTDVVFKVITEQEITDYWHTGEPHDKAGSYAIQGIGGKFVLSINGSVSSVVGLPLVELEQVLKDAGIL